MVKIVIDIKVAQHLFAVYLGSAAQKVYEAMQISCKLCLLKFTQLVTSLQVKYIDGLVSTMLNKL